jgi:hypothetical protein
MSDRFDFAAYADGPGNSGFGKAHGPGIDLRPELPQSTPDLFAVDLSHRIDVADLGLAAAKGGGGGGPGGGGGGGGGSFADFTTAVSNYNITIQFKGTSWTQDAYDIFVAAAKRLAGLVVGDVQDVSVIMKGGVRFVDDIFITAELKAIDGVNGILGQAGPTSVRTNGSLPATGTMQFDSADTSRFIDLDLFDEIVTHEMLHVMGFGTIWDRLGLVSGSNFVGGNAVDEYELLTGGSETGVPLETDGGSGTAFSHWDEVQFDNELMTGYINLSNNLLSRMTVASLEDLGYVVNYGGQIDNGYVL